MPPLPWRTRVPKSGLDPEIVAKLRIHALAHRPSEVRRLLSVLEPLAKSPTIIGYLWKAFSPHVALRTCVEAVGATRSDEEFDEVFAPYWPNLQAYARHWFSTGEYP
jgi:hypothetical protein